MEIRNPVYTELGNIDCEINHQKFGWIPFTACETDEQEYNRNVFSLAKKLNPKDYVSPPLPSPEVELQNKRLQMKCSRLQGRITLGEATCTALDTMAADPNTPWAMREAIKNAGEWQRNSPTMDELGWLLGYTPEQMDTLFEQAVSVVV